MLASCGRSTRTSWRWSHGRPMSKGRARSRCASWSVRHCGCVPTGSWSARYAARREPTCSRRSTRGVKADAELCTPPPRADVPARIEALAMAAGMPQPAVHSQLASALDAVVHLARDQAGRRRVGEIAVLLRGPTGLVTSAPAVTFPGDGSTHEHQAADLLSGKLRR